MPRNRTARSYGNSILFFKELSHCSPQWLHQFTFPPTVSEASLSPYALQYLLFVDFLTMAILTSFDNSL